MAEIIEIENNQHFVELTKEFDKTHNTKTHFVEMTLNEIWDNFYLPSDPDIRWWANNTVEYTNAIISSKIKEMFVATERNIVYNTDADITEGMIGKINSMYMMKLDIQSGKGFIDPMCVSMFPNGNNPLHPGGTRMNWANHYNKKMKIVLTNYSMPINFPVKSIEEFDYNLENKGFSFMVGNSIEDSNWASYKKAAMDLNITYKQIQNLSEEYHIFLRPNEIEERIKFQMYQDALLVNDEILALKCNDAWMLVIE